MKQNKRFLIVGPSGSGKSELGRFIAKRYRGPVVAIDPKWDSFIDFPSLEITPSILGKNLDLASLVRERGKVSIFPGGFDEVAFPLLLRYFASRIKQIRNCLLVIDEAHLMAPRYGGDKQAKLLWSDGRHHRIHLLAITQMPVELDLWVLKQSNSRMAFRVEYPAEVKLIAQYWGVRDATVKNLPPYTFLYRNERGHGKYYPADYLTGFGHSFLPD